MHKFLFYNKFIIFLYMFRALLCSSSGEYELLSERTVPVYEENKINTSVLVAQEDGPDPADRDGTLVLNFG